MGKLAVIGLIVLLLVLAEVISLLQLRSSVAGNARYWQQRSSQAGELTYVALGDSAAQGIGASRPQNGYVGVLADRLAQKTGKTIRVVNLSVTGAKIQDVLDEQIPQLKNYRPDFVTIEIGANDVVAFKADSFRQRFDSLVGLLPPGTVVANMPNFGGRIKRVQAVRAANQIIAAAAAKSNLRTADLYDSTKSHESALNYAADLFHPNNRGYKNWADAFWAVLDNE